MAAVYIFRQQRDRGLDPIDERRAARAAAKAEAARTMTFEACAAAYIKAHAVYWRSVKHAAQWEATLKTYAYPILGKLPVVEVDTALVMKVLKPIWTEKPEAASRLRGRI